MNRMRSVDIARGIAIISIILGHMSIGMVNRVVYTFHVPIFYVLTGYFMKPEKLKCFVKRKARIILLPYMVTCFAIIFFSSISAFLREDDIVDTMLKWAKAGIYGAGDSYTVPFKVTAIGAIWFLWATFWGSIFLQVSLRWNSIVRILWIAILFAVGYLTAQKIFWFPLSIQAGCCATMYMYVGFSIKNRLDEIRKLPVKIKLFGMLLAGGMWGSFIYTFRSFWLVHNDFGTGAIDVFCSLCACLCVFMIAMGVDHLGGKLATILAYFGKNSLIVLCVHIIELDLINWGSFIEYMSTKGIPYLAAGGIAFVLKFVLIILMTVGIVTIKQKKYHVG